MGVLDGFGSFLGSHKHHHMVFPRLFVCSPPSLTHALLTGAKLTGRATGPKVYLLYHFRGLKGTHPPCLKGGGEASEVEPSTSRKSPPLPNASAHSKTLGHHPSFSFCLAYSTGNPSILDGIPIFIETPEAFGRFGPC